MLWSTAQHRAGEDNSPLKWARVAFCDIQTYMRPRRPWGHEPAPPDSPTRSQYPSFIDYWVRVSRPYDRDGFCQLLGHTFSLADASRCVLRFASLKVPRAAVSAAPVCRSQRIGIRSLPQNVRLVVPPKNDSASSGFRRCRGTDGSEARFRGGTARLICPFCSAPVPYTHRRT